MAAISDIKKMLTEESHLISESVEKEELIINDETLDFALECTSSINELNNSYLRVLNGLDELSILRVQQKSDEDDIHEILNSLKDANTKCIALWIDFNNDDFLKIACKSALLDLRINIRVMKEYIDEIHDKFFLKDKHTDELDTLFNSL